MIILVTENLKSAWNDHRLNYNPLGPITIISDKKLSLPKECCHCINIGFHCFEGCKNLWFLKTEEWYNQTIKIIIIIIITVQFSIELKVPVQCQAERGQEEIEISTSQGKPPWFNIIFKAKSKGNMLQTAHAGENWHWDLERENVNYCIYNSRVTRELIKIT